MSKFISIHDLFIVLFVKITLFISAKVINNSYSFSYPSAKYNARNNPESIFLFVYYENIELIYQVRLLN